MNREIDWKRVARCTGTAAFSLLAAISAPYPPEYIHIFLGAIGAAALAGCVWTGVEAVLTLSWELYARIPERDCWRWMSALLESAVQSTRRLEVRAFMHLACLVCLGCFAVFPQQCLYRVVVFFGVGSLITTWGSMRRPFRQVCKRLSYEKETRLPKVLKDLREERAKK